MDQDRNNITNNNGNNSAPKQKGLSVRSSSRGEAIRAQRRNQEDAQRVANQYAPATANGTDPQPRRANVIVDEQQKLRVTFLGGQEAIGEKNMQVIEWQNDAVILDCGNDLGIELPGINYTIADQTYLDSIKH